VAIEVVLPNLGISVERGKILEWMKSEGDTVSKGEILFVVEVEKVTTEVESSASGILAKIIVPKGIEVPILTVVGIIVEVGEEIPEEYDNISKPISQSSKESKEEPASTAFKEEQVTERTEIRIVPAARRLAEENEISLEGLTGTGPKGVIIVEDIEEALAAKSSKIRKTSPVAWAMAEANHIELADVRGSGPGGRIVKADIHKILEEKEVLEKKEKEMPPRALNEGTAKKEAAEVIPINGIRRIIFENMYHSLSQTAQLTLHTEVSGEALIRLRNAYNKKDQKVSYNAIFIKIVAVALRRHPRINASVDGNEIRVWKQVNIGLAMESNDALIVPVLKAPDLKDIRQIQKEAAELVRKTKENKLSPDDLASGTFTITNLGFADIDYFTPILRPPESAILGIGRIVKKPIFKNELIVAENRIGLSLTFDHRIIDGAPAGRFLKTIKELIEEPALMI